MLAKVLFDAQQMHAHPESRGVGIAHVQRREDGLVLGEGLTLDAFLVERPPHACPDGAASQAMDHCRQRGIAGRLRDHPVEVDVGLHDGVMIDAVVVDHAFHAMKRVRGGREFGVGDPQRGAPCRLHFEHAPH